MGRMKEYFYDQLIEEQNNDQEYIEWLAKVNDDAILMSHIEENQLAMANGFTCHKDKNRGGDCCWFSKNNLYIWKIRTGWISSFIEDRIYTNHIEHKSLIEALKRS